MNRVTTNVGQVADPTAGTLAGLPPPSIPDLDGDSLDLEKLGSDPLITYVMYPGIALGDTVLPQFFGRGANGDVVDRERTPLVIQQLESDGRFKVELANNLLARLDKGIAFYSYAKIDVKAGVQQLADLQSARVLLYINKQLAPGQQLPPAHFKDSDGLVVDLRRFDGNGVVVTSAYPAMAVKDRVQFTFKSMLETTTTTLELEATDVGRPLEWPIQRSSLELLRQLGLVFEISWSVVYDGDEGRAPVSYAPSQSFTVFKEDPSLPAPPVQEPSLPAPRVEGHQGGDLDPIGYPDGLVVEIDDYGLLQGDDVLLHVQGKESTRASLRVERTLQDSGRLHFVLGPQWLQDNTGATVSLSYQWARLGAAGDSKALELTLRKPLELPLPIFEGATPKDPELPELPDPDISEYGFILPMRLMQGGYVKIPPEAYINGGLVTVHLDGFGPNGSYSTTEPTLADKMRYQIPSRVVPANLDKRTKVYYTVTLDGRTPQPSPKYGLRIEDLESSNYGAVQCPQSAGGQLSLSALGNADLRLLLDYNSWRFFAEGQIVRVRVTGNPMAGKPALETVRNDVPVTAQEANEGVLNMALSNTFLRGLQLNHRFSVMAWVSFDEGYSFKQLQPADILLVV
jgi:hypothetical protein